ncbi:uncharacterized protein DEA37_0005302 [Paragonimus westermani]|uniref:Small ribosomal subunit protein uS10 domain-containing protein n=1 Tax=Paragonimus westermani TaxID=34504 RepID=A0A5J4NYN5_9TREM|nr:uncharacterized protein DEA37_0005302 [Paragonimus westermani]
MAEKKPEFSQGSNGNWVRITLTAASVKPLEVVSNDLITRAKDRNLRVKGPVRMPTKRTAQSLLLTGIQVTSAATAVVMKTVPISMRLVAAALESPTMYNQYQARVVHLEVVHSSLADSLMVALVRFLGRRGAPEVICSDNIKNFVGAYSQLKERLRGFAQRRMADYPLIRKIDSHFNTPGW